MSDTIPETIPDELPTEAVTGPGHRLRLARERKGLDVKTVAEHLHLHEHSIEALENDDYSALPGPVFVQGYLRNFARLVDEPVDDILSNFGKIRPSEDYHPSLGRSDIRSRIKPYRGTRSHGVLKTIIWLLILLVCVVFVVWWRGYIDLPLVDRPGEGQSAVLAPMLEAPAPAQAPSNPAAESTGGATTESASVAEVGVGDQGSDASLSPSPASEAVPVAVAPAPADASVDQAEPGLPTDGGAEPAALTAETGAAAPAAENAPVDATPEGSFPAADEGVVLEFTAPCWVDVRDAGGNKVLYGGIGKGERHVLEGTPPYRLVLGNHAAVQITVAGKPYDTSLFGARVARFTLDPEAPPTGSSGESE